MVHGPRGFVRVQAENEKDARAIVLAEIAKREGSKVHDQVFFDYDTGIKNKTLRAELSTAEIFKDKDGKIVDEREHVLERLVGSNGFTRDSSGKLAITPEGQNLLRHRHPFMRVDVFHCTSCLTRYRYSEPYCCGSSV